jgi:methylated-DNA-protein-cysteine methyltransferase-like protein
MPKIRYEDIYEVVRAIPRGRVATYGQVAELAGIAGQPRRVGYALSALTPASGVPWQRVINAKGEISNAASEKLQRRLLKEDGIKFDKAGRIPLDKYRWLSRWSR